MLDHRGKTVAVDRQIGVEGRGNGWNDAGESHFVFLVLTCLCRWRMRAQEMQRRSRRLTSGAALQIAHWLRSSTLWERRTSPWFSETTHDARMPDGSWQPRPAWLLLR